MAEDLLGEDLIVAHIEKTAESGERMEKDSDGIRTYDASDVLQVEIPADGSAPTLPGFALLASPAFTGTPTAPTPAANDNDTSIATTAYVQTELADFIAILAGGMGGLTVHSFNGVTIPENTVTNLYTFPSVGNNYVGGLALCRANRAADGSNTYFSAVAFRADNNLSGVTKLGEQNWNVLTAPTFSMTAAGTGQKSLRVNTVNAGVIGNSTWEGIIFAFRDT